MYVTGVKFTDLKGFDTLDFDFTRPDGSCAGWTVFVGGNSSGKSTLLKGISLALMGPDFGRQLIDYQSGWIRSGKLSAEVSLEVFGDKDMDTLKQKGRYVETFSAGVRWKRDTESENATFNLKEKRKPNKTRIKTPENGLWNPNVSGWFCAGYGPMRRLSGSSSEAMRFMSRTDVVGRFVTLFREDATLSESEAWLKMNYARGLEADVPEKQADYQNLINNVRQLLGDGLLPIGLTISRIMVDKVFVKDKSGVELPMKEISDGCRGIYATILDLIHQMHEVYGGNGLFKNIDNHIVVNRPGVVLIDEIEAHLHPQWQREIPAWLKSHFPKVQFLVTTHSPLVAQAADDNGIFVLPSPDDKQQPRPLSNDEATRIRMGRAEKTLLGTAFGLKATRTDWALKKIKDWELLDAKKKAGVRLSATERNTYENDLSYLKSAYDDEVPYETN